MLMDDSGFDAYQQVEVEAKAAAASPYQLVLMLVDGFMDNLTRAEGHMDANRLKEKGESIGKCIDIIGGLNSALDMRQGGELAQQMNQLYDFCTMRLFEASVHNDADKLAEVRSIMGNIQQGWHNFGVAHEGQ